MVAAIRAVKQSFPGRQECLANAYNEHSASLKGYLMKTVSEAEAEDLMHDVYVRMASHSGLCKVENLRAFMFTTATNLLRDRWRRANAAHAPHWVSLEDHDVSTDSGDPAEVMQWRDSLEKVSRTFDEMPENSQRAFSLSRFGGQSYAEIAEQLEVSVSMIEKHISLVLCGLRKAVAA